MELEKCPRCGGSVVYTNNLVYPKDMVKAECCGCGLESDWCRDSVVAYHSLQLRSGGKAK